MTMGEGTPYMAQERMVPHAGLKCFGSDVLHTIRFITVLDGDVQIAQAALRIGLGELPVDNTTKGNAVAGIDLASGTLRTACRTQRRSVSAEQPILPAIELIAPHCAPYSPACSSTIRTARARTSGDSRSPVPCLSIAPSSQSPEPPANPGRLSVGARAEARRVGKECVHTCRARCGPVF